MKKSYISPPTGSLDITIVRDKEPYCTILLDLGIPNFTVFSLKMPVVNQPGSMTALLAEALSALLDEMSAFMLSLKFKEGVIVRTYATVLSTFAEMTPDSTTDASLSEIGKDNTVVTYEGSFQLPMDFVDETYDKVVTGSQVTKRLPKQRHVELTVLKPQKTTVEDVGKVIRQYRGRSLKTQPKSMFVVVYDQRGRPTGTLSLGPNFRNNLLKRVNSSATPQFTDTLKYERANEMLYKNAVGIPKSIYVADEVFFPEAVCGDDMALYASTHRYLVKFPDGRVVKFPARPTVRQLKNKNYPVPSPYFQWSLIKDEVQAEPAEDEIDFSEAKQAPEGDEAEKASIESL